MRYDRKADSLAMSLIYCFFYLLLQSQTAVFRQFAHLSFFIAPFKLADNVTLHNEGSITSLPGLVMSHFDCKAAENLWNDLVHLCV